MKTPFLLFVCVMLVVSSSTTSCRSHRAQKSTSFRILPPGHAKKLAGHQSARAFAPGQQKKVVRTKKKRG
ncbi:MAG TPA: hypothetical protein VFZ78_10550 [Flavisolibacter sp.]